MNTLKPLFANFKSLISNDYFQGLSALVSLIAAIASDNLWIRVPAILVSVWLLLSLRLVILTWIRSIILPLVQRTFTWLTWKFVLGFSVGLITAAILAPVLELPYQLTASVLLPQVEVLDSTPEDEGELLLSNRGIYVSFSQLIPYRYRWLVKAEIIPATRIKKTWLYISDPKECCRTLYIESAEFLPNIVGTAFKPNKTYHLYISGLLLKHPIDLEFRTPPQ